MKKESAKKWLSAGLLALALAVPGLGVAQVTFDQIVVFGTSLSDPGNAYALTGLQNTPPYDQLDPTDPFLIPSAPYAIGGHHFTNGETWIEQFGKSQALGSNTRPAFKNGNNKATNYAVGGARARNAGQLSLAAQVGRFLTDYSDVAPSDALYVVEVGSNDVQDAFLVLAQKGNPGDVITAALQAVSNNVALLHRKGARKFLIADVPDIGLTPAVHRLDQISPGAKLAMSTLSSSYNNGLATLLAGLQATFSDSQFVRLNVFQTVNELTSNPQAFGLSDVTSPCVTPNLPPFSCKSPGVFLFWDGIHPTKTVHSIFAQKAAEALSQP